MIRAIETVYSGYKFRSRLEAKWAVFFDTLSIRYEYEKEGYDLDGIWYLPDFWMPDWNCWVEIKPSILRLRPYSDKNFKELKDEFIRCRKLSDGTDKVVFLIGGNPWIKNLSSGENVSPYYKFQYEIIVFFPNSVMKSNNLNKALQNTGFKLHLEKTGGYDLLNHQFYSSSKDNSLYWFIQERYKDSPSCFTKSCPKRGDVYGLIEADSQYYFSKKKESHFVMKHGLVADRYVFNYTNKKIILMSELHGRDKQGKKILEAYSIAQQERFQK